MYVLVDLYISPALYDFGLYTFDVLITLFRYIIYVLAALHTGSLAGVALHKFNLIFEKYLPKYFLTPGYVVPTGNLLYIWTQHCVNGPYRNAAHASRLAPVH